MNSEAPLLVLLGRATCERRPVIEAALETAWRIEQWQPGDDEARLGDLMSRADAVVPGGDALMAGGVFGALANAHNLKFLQLPFTGYEWLDFAQLPKGLVVANAYGHEIAMAEFVLGAMLQREKDFCALDRAFRAGSWLHRAVGVNDFGQGELAGKTLGLVGYGAIGGEIAKRAAAFDMRVIAVSRSKRDAPPPLAWHGIMEKLPELLATSDYVALTCALNDETRGLIGTEEFAAMKSDATLINVARAGVVDENALYDALEEKRIGGAILDVWYQYPAGSPPNPESGGPAPSARDFAALDNVLMTPHCSANTEGSDVRRYQGIARNLNLVARGQRPATFIGEGTKQRD